MTRCSRCGLDKPPEAFPKYGRRCRACHAANAQAHRDRIGRDAYNEYQRAYRAQNPAAHAEWSRKKNLARFGLTPESFDALLIAQDRGCAICGTDSPGGKGAWHVDHDHSCCGRKAACDSCRRGLLCFACNIAIGYMCDNPDRLRAAAAYLEGVLQWQ